MEIQIAMPDRFAGAAAPDSAADWLAAGDVSPYREMGAYEWLWLNSARDYAEMAEVFRRAAGLLPSEIVSPEHAAETADKVLSQMQRAGVASFTIRANGMLDYPVRLRDTPHPAELLYCQGWTDLLAAPRSVAIVGTREITDKGIRRTKKLVQMLIERRCLIVSNLERGVGATAHETAIAEGGATMAVLATPLSHHDPRADHGLRRSLAADHLIVSPAPVLAYDENDERMRRMFVAERGRIMAALTDATIIVEAGAISTAVKQGEAALELGRKLFILNGCFDQPGVKWPAELEAKGAVRVREFDQIARALKR
jgi:DNA processing protein